ncbi:multiheme c-type cytochrome [Novipirellula artificiosorum]|uniref:Cytochrome c-552/4 domain-containing protein n=1 Tax=Novipirellula artificiosorum TaxID=2528016 RepID=A0A5C6D919_9BACT|nr:multiheme c-type cytochrome [Novipirellula artificiosorum]TWU31349.1 hypothetical protein Poly41_62180 [Novipirellula artificiosorum]
MVFLPTRFTRLLALFSSGLLCFSGSLVSSLSLAEDSPTASVANRRDDVVEAAVSLRVQNESHFLDSKNCAVCHSNSNWAVAMRDAKRRPVAPYDLWQSSMMANSSRDPFWRAVLSAEVAATPSMKGVIEEKCTRCHTPMAAPTPESPDGKVLAYLTNQDQRSQLGLDGVSCTVCHQIADQNLGTDASFTGHFEINQERKIFGPHADPFTMPMQHHVGYTPTHSNHVLKSGLCATCHTVMTHSVDADGRPTAGEFHEQTPYLEWRNSVFNDEVDPPSNEAKSCQACHMPTTDVDGEPIATRIAHNPGGRDFPFLGQRTPFGRHAFLGGNTLMKRILRDNAKELGVIAPAEAFDQSIQTTLQFLQNESAEIEIKTVSVEGNQLRVPVVVRNRSGHKLPTAYPSRRVWVELVVTDVNGQTVFSSGQTNSDGELVDADGNVLISEQAGGPVNEHHSVVNQSDQVQVYETIMGDADGKPTFTLLRGATYVKDNRLLPRGWDPDHADGPATRPYGIGEDRDFVGGSDSLIYEIPIPSPGEYTVKATLMFQVITPRHASELFRFETPEVARFRRLFEQANRKPEALASTTQTVSAGQR